MNNFEDDWDNSFTETDSEFYQQDFSDGSADFFSNSGVQDIPIYDEVASTSEPQVKFGYKTVGVVVAVVLIFLALFILGASKIKFIKNTSSNIQATNQTTSTSKESNSSSQATPQKGVTSLINIPPETDMDYSGSIIQAHGVVSKLSKYLQDGQVIYCINLDITIGSSTTTVHYYCGYNTFSQVQVGDILNVEYQQVSNTCYSVCTIYK